MTPDAVRAALKRVLAPPIPRGSGEGVTILTYHRIGGGTADELDVPTDAFAAHLDALRVHEVVSLDDALDRLAAGDRRPAVVLTFDDGFRDLHRNGWPLLAERGLPFTLYLASAYMGGDLAWGSLRAPAVGWDEIADMAASGLCTVGNHTHTHARPEQVTVDELDQCTAQVEARTGVRPQHFAYPWGVRVPAIDEAVRARFRSAATGEVGRNLPGDDLHRLRRVPVRRTDPLPFFRAKLGGRLLPERAYSGVVAAAKRVGVRA